MKTRRGDVRNSLERALPLRAGDAFPGAEAGRWAGLSPVTLASYSSQFPNL